MNFVGKFDAKLPVDGPVGHSAMHAHVDGASTHAPSDAIVVPDAQLLFGGDFKRSGVDLILSDDHHELVLHDYFKGEKRLALSSPDGAHLTGDLVNALAGHVEYAQADGAAAAAVVVGHVTKLTGSATAIRNGVSIILNAGDNIDKGDVLQSGANSTLGVTFIDGTVFGLSSNARMVVNEMIYDPNGSNNSSLLSLVAGTISFVAGETAKHGDMKVDTPVATMGIRGTAVLVEIDFSVPGSNGAPSANFQVLMEPDGTTGSYILFDKNTLAPLATVNTAGTSTKISEGIVSFQAGAPLTPDQQNLINELFTTKFGDITKSFNHYTDTPIPQSLTPINLPGGVTATPVVLIQTNSINSLPVAPSISSSGTQHIPGAPLVAGSSNAFIEVPHTTGGHTADTVSGQINFLDVNIGDQPSVTVEFSVFKYQDASHNDISSALTPQEKAAVAAIEGISVQANPGNNNNGSATWTYSFPDGVFDFLGAGETLTLTYTALVNNNYAQNPETGTATFTIVITGTNDVPVITSSVPQVIAFTAGIHTQGGDLTPHVPTSGTISFDDPDLTDTHTVSVQLLTTGLPPTPQEIFDKALSVSIASDSTGTGFGTINWSLAELPVYLADFIPNGKTITLTYAVTVTDSQGATSTQDITVTITGNDTPAVVWIATTTTGSAPGGLWSDGANWETGTVPTANDDAIIITDQLIGLTPSYPVTIDAKTDAVAKSLTMNDFGTSPPVLINLGTLTIGGAFDMSADSVLHNSGTITVGGLMEVLDESVVQNSGALILQQGGDFSGQSTITNTDAGSIEISGGTLNVQVDVANDGLITVDSGAALTVGIAAISDGTVTNDGTLSLNGVAPSDPSSETPPATGSAVLKDGTLNNAGVLHAETGAVLQNETVTNTGKIEVLALGALTLDDGTSVTNTHGTITVDETGTLTLDDATISGGTLDNSGTVHVEGSSGATLDGVTVIGGGDIQIDCGEDTATTPLVLEGGTTVTDGTLTVGSVGLLDIKTANGATLDDVGVTNNNSIEVFAGSTLTLDDGTSVTNTDGTITVDSTATLKLIDAILSGGTLDNFGTVDIEGSSGATLDGVTLIGGGDIQIDGVDDTTTTPLVLEGGTIITDGTLTVGSIGVLDVKTPDGATLDDVSVTNRNSIEVFGGSALTLDDGTSVTNTHGTITVDETGTLTLDDATVIGGTLDNSGTVHVESSSGVTLDGVTVTGGGDIEVDGAQDTATTSLVLEDGTTITDGTLTVGSVGALDIKTAAGATLDDVGVTNHNSIEVFAGSALTLDDGTSVTNTDGVITIDGTGTLTLDDASISGGTVTNSGTLTLGGTAALKSGTLNNYSQINVSGTDNELDSENVTNTGAIAILALGVLTLDDIATFNNTGGIITVDGTGTLALDDASISGGTINDYSLASPSGSVVAGDIHVTGSSAISSALLNNGQVTLDSGVVLTLDNDTVTGTHFSDAGATIQIDGGTTLKLSDAAINGGTINDYSTGESDSIVAGNIDVTGSSAISNAHLVNGQVTIESGVVLTLDNDTVTGTHFNDVGATIQIDGGTTLKLDGVTINGGAINDYSIGTSGSIVAGDIDVIGNSTISDASLNHGNVTIESGKQLTLDGDTVNGTAFTNVGTGSVIHVDGGDTLTLNDATTVTGGSVTIGADALVKTSGDVTLTNTSVTNDGKIEVTDGILKITGSVGDSTPGGDGSIQIDNGAVLDLNGSDTQDVAFAGDGGKLQIDASSFGGSISGLTAGDQIDLSTIGYGPNTTGTYVSNADHDGGVLTITDGMHSISMTLVGDYSDAHFAGSSDGSSGTLITLNANDDAPAFAVADKAETATVTELADTTGSSASDTSTPASGTLHFTDIDLTDRPSATVAQTVTWSDGTSNLTLTPDQISALEDGFALSQSGNTNNGTLGWTYHISDSALDFLAAGETATVTSTITLDDHQTGQDTATVTVTITGANDLPTITATNGVLAELPDVTGSSTTDTATGTISFSDADLDDHPTVTASLASSNPFDYKDAHGNDLTSTLTTAQLAAVEALESGLALSSANANSGTVDWTYSVTDSALDFMAAGDTLTLNYIATVDDHHGGTATAPIVVTISGANDLPTITGSNGVLAEQSGVTGSGATDTTSGTVSFSDVDLDDHPTVTASLAASNPFDYKDAHGNDLTSTLTTAQLAAIAALENGFAVSPPGANANSGTVGWTYSVTDSALDFMAAGDTLTLNYTATVNNQNGGTASAPITVTITGSDDAPAISGVTTAAVADGGVTDASGHLAATDPDRGDVVTWSIVGGTSVASDTAPAVLQGLYGTLDLDQNGTWQYFLNPGLASVKALAAGQTAQDVFTVAATDGSGVQTTKPVDITVAGINDAPVLAADHSGTNGTSLHSISERAGKTSDTTDHDTASGSLSFTDVDLTDTHTIGQGAPTYAWSGGSLTTTQTDALTAAATLALTETDSTNTGTGSIGFTYSAADGSFDFLAAGETLKVTYNVTVTDEHGASSIQPVTITITGTNDAPVLAADSSGADGLHAITELAGKIGDTADVDSASGTLSFTDVDLSDTHTVGQGAPTYVWSGGSLTTAQTNALTAAAVLALTETDSTHTGSGSIGFTYSAADGSFDFLAAGETLKVTYDVTVSDNHGGSSMQPVTITITGTNDAPVLAADSSGADGVHAINELAGKTGDTADHDSASGALSFTDADLSDTHTVSQAAPTYAWSGGSLTTAQTNALTAAATLALTETDSTHSGSGSIGFSYSAADGSFDFLAAGETLKVTYDVTVSDSHGGSSMQPVTITITGANDAPVLAADSSGANGTALHAITELAGKTGDTVDHDTTSGALSFSDADLTDTHTVSQGSPTYAWSGGALTTAQTNALTAAATLALTETDSTHSGSGSIGFTYSAADGSFDFLAAGQTLKVTYGVTVTDEHGASSAQPVTITITGTNDAPVLAADISGANGTTLHAISELAGKSGDTIDHDSASGSLSFSDADLTDTHTLSHGGPTYTLSGGSLTQAETNALNAAGQLTLSETDSTHTGTGSVAFSYSAADSSFDFLAAGQTLTVSYSITVTDNSGSTSSQPVSFTITGSNDAPVVDAHNATLSYTENHAPTAIDAALTLSDVDSVTLGSATVKISGNFSASEDVLGFSDQHGISGSYDATTGVLSLTGTASVADYQAALASVTYFDSSNNPSAAPRTISFSVDDGASANSHSNIATATVDVTPVNDPPVVTAPAGAIAILENTPTHLSGISVSDVDSGTSDITVTLTLPNGSSGSLSAGNFDGVTVGGSATALTLTGSVAEIDTFLADTQHGVTYTPATNSIQDVTLEVTANDHGATGSGGAMNSAQQPVQLDLVSNGSAPSHASLIANGGFENGDFSGWRVGETNHPAGVNFVIGNDMPHHGVDEVQIGGVGADVTLSQTVTTSVGQHYTLDFWLMNDESTSDGGSTANDFSATWNGVSLMPKIVDAVQGTGYTEYQFDVIGTGGPSTLEFSARNDSGTWDIDDVSLRQGVPNTAQQVTNQITSVSGVHSGDALTVTPAESNPLGTVTAVAGDGVIDWQFAASNAQLDHLMAVTQSYTVSDSSNPGVAQTVAVSIGGLGNDQFVFKPGVGADTMVNFPTASNSQGSYVGDTIELDNFSNIQSVHDVLQHLSTDAHGNAVVDLGNHDSITFQGISAATVTANAMHMFVLHSTSGNNLA